jgi:hypothetical protein
MWPKSYDSITPSTRLLGPFGAGNVMLAPAAAVAVAAAGEVAVFVAVCPATPPAQHDHQQQTDP